MGRPAKTSPVLTPDIVNPSLKGGITLRDSIAYIAIDIGMVHF
jgi:hypothetical protein